MTQHDTAQHGTTQDKTTQHNTTQHNTTQHNTTHHNTTQQNATQRNTTQHNTTQHITTQPNRTQHNPTEHNTTQHNTTQHNTTQHNTTQHNTTQHNTTQHNTTQHNTAQRNKTQHNTTQHNAMQHNTTQHNSTPEDVHAVGYPWLNVRGRYPRPHLLAQALHMAACRPTILILAEAQSKVGPEDPPFQDYTRHVVLPAHGKTGAGLDVYVRAGTATRATLLWGKEDANALLMEVLTPWGKHHVLAAHTPQINIGVHPYVRWWAGI